MKFTVPNIITLLRIAISPVFFVYIIKDNPSAVITACIFYTVGASTDYLDGWLARKYNEETPFGKFIDPLADKFLTTAAFIAFNILDIIPLWMVIIIILRDLLTTFMRVYADSIGKSISTSFSAKAKTMIQMFFIAFILALILLKNLGAFSAVSVDYIIYSRGTYIAMLLLTALTVWTAIEYLYQNKTVLLSLKKSIAGKAADKL